MAGAVWKVFGVLFLLTGILFLVAGVGAAVYGALDESDHQEDQGPFGMGDDPDRQRTNDALVAAGAAAVGGGILLITTGIIFMLIGGRDRQQQQQVVVSDGSPSLLATQAQSMASSPARWAIVGVVGVLVVGLLFVGLAGDTPAGQALLSGGSPDPTLRTDVHVGDMGPSMYGGAGPAYGGHEESFTAPAEAENLQAQYTWDGSEGAPRLRLIISIDDGENTELTRAILVPGDTVELSSAGRAWAGATLVFRIEPADAGIYQGQSFTGVIHWLR